jgi:hypothetical protein
MTQSVFRSLLIHRCDIEQATRGTASGDSYGHEEPSYGPPETVAYSVPCLLQPLSITELTRLGMTATVQGIYALYLAAPSLPSTLSMTVGLNEHQIVNVRRYQGGVLIDPGPFDITSVSDEAGQGHHYRLLLQRVS